MGTRGVDRAQNQTAIIRFRSTWGWPRVYPERETEVEPESHFERIVPGIRQDRYCLIYCLILAISSQHFHCTSASLFPISLKASACSSATSSSPPVSPSPSLSLQADSCVPGAVHFQTICVAGRAGRHIKITVLVCSLFPSSPVAWDVSFVFWT